MQGYVLAFRPGTGSGTIVADSGQTFSFSDHPNGGDLHGGDLVSFQAAALAGGLSSAARDVRLLQRGSERLTASERPLVRRLFTALQRPAESR